MCLPVKPYKVEQEWTAYGLLCAVVQAREAGHRCGYVRVPPGHPAHGQSYHDIAVNVHGSLTFAEVEPCAHEDGIGYWLGFDCIHAGDVDFDPSVDMDALSEEGRSLIEYSEKLHEDHPIFKGEHYWTQEEVVQETEQLAKQLAAMTKVA